MAASPIRFADLRGLRILVVEDEFLVAMELESIVQELGGEVIGPLGGLDEAVAVAREEALDAALLDVNVGGRLVTPVADALAARDIPFVFCTGYDDASVPGRHAAAPILMKPCQAHELKNALSRSLRDRPAPLRASPAPSGTDARAGTSSATRMDGARRPGPRPGD